MFGLIRSLRVALLGMAVAGLRITLYLLLFNFTDLKPSPGILKVYAALSIAMTLGGLLTALVGAITRAGQAPRRQVLLVAAKVTIAIIL